MGNDSEAGTSLSQPVHSQEPEQAESASWQPEENNGNSAEAEQENKEAADTETADSDAVDTPQEEEGSRLLVVYFSATGTTKALAEYAADAMGADIYEIVPEEPYTSADLNYGDNESRSSTEQNDEAARPAISGSVENMEQYDTVFLAYPYMEQGFESVLCV